MLHMPQGSDRVLKVPLEVGGHQAAALHLMPSLAGVGSFLGVKLLGEHLGPHAWLGGGLILAAAVTLTTRGHESEPAVILE